MLGLMPEERHTEPTTRSPAKTCHPKQSPLRNAATLALRLRLVEAIKEKAYEVDEDEIYDKNVFKCHNSKLKPKLPHHLKTPPWHGAPNDVLVVLVGEVVAAQLDAELLQLLAKGNMMQHIRRKVVGKELLFVVGGAAATRHFYGVA